MSSFHGWILRTLAGHSFSVLSLAAWQGRLRTQVQLLTEENEDWRLGSRIETKMYAMKRNDSPFISNKKSTQDPAGWRTGFLCCGQDPGDGISCAREITVVMTPAVGKYRCNAGHQEEVTAAFSLTGDHREMIQRITLFLLLNGSWLQPEWKRSSTEDKTLTGYNHRKIRSSSQISIIL